MTSSQKRGFRLPWAVERGPDEEAADPARLDLLTADGTTGVVRDDLGEGPFRLSGEAQAMTTDAAPAAADVPDDTPEAAMTDAEAPSSDSTAAAPLPEGAPGGWPMTDRRGPGRPFTGEHLSPRVEGEPRVPRRDNPLVAGLVKAMREAAIASRAETTARLAAEATARIEAIRERATAETTDLRKRADDDVIGIREWSKAEIARLRQETDERIEARRAELAAETQRHAASVDSLVEEVQTTVTSFEADMDRFFEQLLAENDPARLATLAERAPDPPDLRGDGPLVSYYEDEAGAEYPTEDTADDAAEPDRATESDDTVEPEAVEQADTVEPEALEPEAVEQADDNKLHADDAALAEAAATEGLDPGAAEAWPAAALANTRRADVEPSPADANGPGSTRLLVSGLTSVAGISAFKGALAQLSGVRAVSVSSGAPGVFVFAVSHDPGVDLDSGVASLAGFAAHVTDATDDGFTVAAHEPAA